MAQGVDVNLFVNAASKGFNDGARVPSPFAAFVDSAIKGLDAQQDYETQAIRNEQASYETQIKETQALEAQMKQEAIEADPEKFKQGLIADIEAKAQEKERLAIYQTKKNKLIEIMNSGDGKLQEQAYLSGDFKEVFNLDPQLKERYVDATYENWGAGAKDVYREEARTKRERETNESLDADAYKNYEKGKIDYEKNPEINDLKMMIQKETGEPVSDSDLFDNGFLTSKKGRKQIPKTVPEIGPDGNPVMLSDGKTPKPVPDPSGGFMDDPNDRSGGEYRNVLEYKGKTYQVGPGISGETYRLFNGMQSSYRRIHRQDKGQGGITDLDNRVRIKEETATKKQAEAQAEANKTTAQIQSEREKFYSGSNVAFQEYYKKRRLQVEQPTVQTPQSTFTPVPTGTPTPIETATQGPSGPTMSSTPTPTPRAIQTGSAAPTLATRMPQASQAGTPTPTPLSQEQIQAQAAATVKAQAQATKASQFLSKHQATPDKPITPPVSQTVQNSVTEKSPYIPPQVTTDIPYAEDIEAINRVASAPEMAGLSALTKALVAHESRGVSSARSPTDVVGLAQVTNTVGKAINPDFDRTNPVHSALAGAFHLSELNRRYENNPMLALTAYNGGTAVVNEAIRMAGTTDWKVVKDFLLPAGQSERVQAAWRTDFVNAKLSNKKIEKRLKTKPYESASYAEKVIVNFPAFMFNADDDAMLQTLKQQGVFNT